MTHLILITVLALLLLIAIGYIRTLSTTSEPLYSDKGRGSRVFKDEIRRLKAKPDRLEGTSRKASLIEYKSRYGRVYHSDVVQAIVSVLAVRAGGIHVVNAEVRTRGGSVKTLALGNNAKLEKMIEIPLHNARLVMSGGVPKATSTKVKCKGCGFRQVCEFAG